MELSFGKCPKCGAKFTEDNWSWYIGSTEEGTDFIEINVVCLECAFEGDAHDWTDEVMQDLLDEAIERGSSAR